MPNGTSARYVVAVSGGIDSVVLLDALVSRRTIGGSDPWAGRKSGELIVAHFDHGIREDSASDETFVRHLAETYGLEYYSQREELGKNASEDRARQARYAFLHRICEEQNAVLVTAHHAGDIVETVAINIVRGTGWRGLAVMDSKNVWRPLLEVEKQEIREYASHFGIKWREDSTNTSDVYLRNRLRTKLHDDELRREVLALRARQVELKRDIDAETKIILGEAPYSRYFFTHCGDTVACELLRGVFIREVGSSPTIRVRRRIVHEIKVARHGATAHVASGVSLRFTRTNFIVDTSDKVLS